MRNAKDQRGEQTGSAYIPRNFLVKRRRFGWDNSEVSSFGGILFRILLLILILQSNLSFGMSCEDSLLPQWAREHQSPKPLTSDLIAAVEKIPEFDNRKTKIMIPIAAGASTAGVDAIISRAKHMKNGVELHMWVNGISPAVLEKIKSAGDKVKVVAHFLGPNMRALYRDNHIELVPGYLRHFAQRVEEGHADYQFDVIFTRVARYKDTLNFGANCDLVCTVVTMQPKVKIIAEVNSKVPVTFGRTGPNSVPSNRILAIFESDSKLAHPEVVPLTEVEKEIGKNLATIVPDGATLQVGIGNIFSGLPEALKIVQRKGLSIWSEMMGDVLKEIMGEGIATKAMIGFAFGSQDFYNWLNLNPKVFMLSTSIINDPRIISSIPKFHAINTALQVSLTGEVNATTGPAEKGRISSPGGQVEFLLGASWSPAGKSIIAIRSTATVSSGTKEQVLSSIVLRTYPVRDGTPNSVVSHVVTEYGIAEILGVSERERAIRLIQIAHPDFRSMLFEGAIDPNNPDHIPALRESDRARAISGGK